ncbi:MAG: anti-sigma factor [Anaerolineae bacterium]|nr:anti-sigma factor [Anaerolineae bacterium]
MTTTMNCDELLDLIPAYRIGATDPDETRQIDEGLQRCPQLAAELARYEAVTLALARGVPQTAPPPELLGNLMTAARQTRPRRRIPAAWLAAAALLLVFIALNNLYWITRLNAERGRELRLPTAAEGAATSATARVLWSADEGEAVLIAVDFPPLAADASYQAWVRRGENVASLGVFRVDEQGAGTLTFAAEMLREPFDIVGVTREPLGGSAGPTSPPVVRWQKQ